MYTKTKHHPYVSIALVLVIAIGLLGNYAPARAQSGSAGDLISAVNAFRTSNGLEAYAVDGGLMSLAQSHSEYQASIQSCTHTREDGSGPGSYGISAENIACGPNLSVQDAIYYQWADNLHTSTILGPDTGLVGAGVAVAENTTYYTLTVKRLSGDFNYVPPTTNQDPPADNAAGIAADSSAEQASLSFQDAASTPNEDGSISHIVQYGETLISIAEIYDITLADLISINNLDPNNPAIFEKQALLIRVAYTLTPFITSTYTPRPPTRTPLPSRTPRPTRTATVLSTPLPTRTATPEPLIKIPDIDDLGAARPIMAYSLIGIGALGLIILFITAFLPKKK